MGINSTTIGVIGLRNVLAMQRGCKDADDKGLELVYDSSEATMNVKFYSNNAELVDGWVNSINVYNGYES